MTNYHPTLEQLIDYSSGALTLSHALCVSSHVDQCEECQQTINKLNMIGSTLFEQADVLPRDHRNVSAMKQNVMDLIANDAEQAPESMIMNADKRNVDKSIPSSLRQFVPQSWQDVKWKSVTPSFRIATLCKDKDGSEVALSRVKPGGRMPHHSHTGDELTVVLKGSFSDEDGIYVKGDFVQRNAKDKHTPVVTNDGECICLMVLDAPIQFTGFFARVVNPLLRLRHSHA